MITLQCKLPIQNLKEVLTELRLLNTSSCTYTRTALILWTLCFTTKTIHSLTILKTLTIPFIFSFGDHTPALKKIAFRFFYLQTNTPPHTHHCYNEYSFCQSSSSTLLLCDFMLFLNNSRSSSSCNSF